MRCAADVDATAATLSNPQELAAALEWQAPLVARALDDKRNALDQIKRALGISAPAQPLPQPPPHQDHVVADGRSQDFAEHLLRTGSHRAHDPNEETLQQT